MAQAFEIDFFPVGDNSKSGDAIALRFGEYENGVWKTQTVFVIDGGNLTSGAALVKHITEVYKTDKVDRLILTHPDGDHASGLRTVLENMKVGKIWMHRPWNHWPDLKDSIKDGRITKISFGERLKNAYQYAYDIEQIALKKGIEIYAPHQGCNISVRGETILKVLGPGKDFYLSLIEASDKTPHMDIREGFDKSLSEVKGLAYETFDFNTENLSETDADTSSENDMSLILLFTYANNRILFTGDAGTMGLYKAIYYCIEHNIDLKNLEYFQVPHHGSRHNLSKGVLDKIYAPFSVVSCAINGYPIHPSPIVTNALIRRNIKVCYTKGNVLCLQEGCPMRPGYSIAPNMGFINWVNIIED